MLSFIVYFILAKSRTPCLYWLLFEICECFCMQNKCAERSKEPNMTVGHHGNWRAALLQTSDSAVPKRAALISELPTLIGLTRTSLASQLFLQRGDIPCGLNVCQKNSKHKRQGVSMT